MPLVISHKAKCKYYIHDEEVLAEILGHSDFDGEYWAIGDMIVFEDGTEAKIEQPKGELFHVWSEPVPSDLRQVVELINQYHPVCPLKHANIDSWGALFTTLANEQGVATRGCFVLILTVGAIIGLTAVNQMA